MRRAIVMTLAMMLLVPTGVTAQRDDPSSRVWAMVPEAIDADCEEYAPSAMRSLVGPAVAGLQCIPNGPEKVTDFSLFLVDSDSDLRSLWTDRKEERVGTAAGACDRNQLGVMDTAGGELICYRNNGKAAIRWIDERNRLYGALDTDWGKVAYAYDWWQKNLGSVPDPMSARVPPDGPSPSDSAATLPAGTWVGEVHQPNALRSRYGITMTVPASCTVGGACGSVEYPDLACGGEMTYQGVVGGASRLQEALSGGSCIEDGLVDLRLNGDSSLDWRWYLSTGEMWATATLTRYGLDGPTAEAAHDPSHSTTATTDATIPAAVTLFAPLVYLHPDEDLRPYSAELYRAKALEMPPSEAAPDGYLDAHDGTRAGFEDLALAPAYFEYEPGAYIVYWFFYAADRQGPTGDEATDIKSHEGDWEHVAIRLDDMDEPTHIAYYQHECLPVIYEWDDLAGHEPFGSWTGFWGETHPIVYSALGSHASYWGPRSRTEPIGADCPKPADWDRVPDMVWERVMDRRFDTAYKGNAWKTWEGAGLVDAKAQDWYGYLGLWGSPDADLVSLDGDESLVERIDWSSGGRGPGPNRITEVVPGDWVTASVVARDSEHEPESIDRLDEVPDEMPTAVYEPICDDDLCWFVTDVEVESVSDGWKNVDIGLGIRNETDRSLPWYSYGYDHDYAGEPEALVIAEGRSYELDEAHIPDSLERREYTIPAGSALCGSVHKYGESLIRIKGRIPATTELAGIELGNQGAVMDVAPRPTACSAVKEVTDKVGRFDHFDVSAEMVGSTPTETPGASCHTVAIHNHSRLDGFDGTVRMKMITEGGMQVEDSRRRSLTPRVGVCGGVDEVSIGPGQTATVGVPFIDRPDYARVALQFQAAEGMFDDRDGEFDGREDIVIDYP